jgi:hypothetical protein
MRDFVEKQHDDTTANLAFWVSGPVVDLDLLKQLVILQRHRCSLLESRLLSLELKRRAAEQRRLNRLSALFRAMLLS